MRQAWRWFGPKAGVSLDNVRQAGATDIVSALHEVPIGEAWTTSQVHERKSLIESTPAGRTPLTWSVVESIPIPDAVKRLGGAAKHEIAAWIASMEALAANDIKVICYNFMPVVDWCRTDLDYVTPTGSTAMRFDHNTFAVFDLAHPAARRAPRTIIPRPTGEIASDLYEAMGAQEIADLTRNIASALPGSTTEPLTIPAFRDKLEAYSGIDATRLRQHLIEFLRGRDTCRR